jgi:hypothetical protein
MKSAQITLYAAGTVLEFPGATAVHINDELLTFIHREDPKGTTSTKHTTTLPFLIREEVAALQD